MLFYICISLLLCNAFATPKWHLKSSLVRSLVEDYMKKEIKNELEDELKDSSTSNFCSSLPDGDYVDPDTCAGFIKCSATRTFKFPCPASGLYYDPETNRCEYNTRCIDGKLKTLCAGKQDGNYRYPTGCATYMQCYNGVASRRECTEGLAYDQYERKCVANDTARCTIQGNTETCTGRVGRVYVKGEKWYQQYAIFCLQRVCTGQDTYRMKNLCPTSSTPECSNGSKTVKYTPQGLPPSSCSCQKVVCCTNADCTTTSPPPP